MELDRAKARGKRDRRFHDLVAYSEEIARVRPGRFIGVEEYRRLTPGDCYGLPICLVCNSFEARVLLSNPASLLPIPMLVIGMRGLQKGATIANMTEAISVFDKVMV
jgi:hypothetical protein